MKTRILAVDDHPLLRHGLKQALADHPDFDFVGEASTGADALKQVAALHPELVLLDVHLPDMDGIEVTRRLRREWPGIHVVILSGDAERSWVDAALQAGATGYILKQSLIQELTQALRCVLQGKLFISPEVSAGILEDYRRSLSHDQAPAKPALSERDKQVLKLVAEGRRSKEIAAQLNLSAKSIETYRSRLMKKLGCSNSAELIRYAIREGLAGV
jgi:DNA-binding NarL/FixJ family response regulator